LNSNVRLHSHDVKYGSGSGQQVIFYECNIIKTEIVNFFIQSVTAVRNADDHNSYWQLRPKIHSTKAVARGLVFIIFAFDRLTYIYSRNIYSQPVKCGESFRLFHLSTKRNLHSHLFQSPLSNNQEVSAFGENGEGDDGDNWIIDCEDDFWRRDEPVRIKHELTNKYLHITGDTYGRPINGQFEVSCYPYANQLNLWKVMEGIYIKPSSDQHINNEYNHTEL
jgi:dolichyl-phosphate-mannose--protein O-mannosyl transferase